MCNEQIICKKCGSTNVTITEEPVPIIANASKISEEVFDIIKCNDCGNEYSIHTGSRH